MSTLSARVIDLAAYYHTHEGLEGSELDSHVSRLRAIHPYSVGIELLFGEAVVGAWAEVKPFEGIVSEEDLRNASSVSALPDGSTQKALDRAVASKLNSILFPNPYSAG